jgi:hypothetical protein
VILADTDKNDYKGENNMWVANEKWTITFHLALPL